MLDVNCTVASLYSQGEVVLVNATPVPIFLVDEPLIQQHHAESQSWLSASGFRGEPGSVGLVPGANGGISKVLVGRPDPLNIWAMAHLPTALPPLTYTLADAYSPEVATQLCLGWQLGAYSFNKYKQGSPRPVGDLHFPTGVDKAYVDAAAAATFLVRDLINTPAGDMGPQQLEAAVQSIANRFDAQLSTILGDDLSDQNYPLVHAVGRASDQPPRLLDLRWGCSNHPKVTLVGKGVCFDTGGLDIKNANGMRLMKKDMGGAANVLGLAQMVMAMELPVRLRVLIPAVENSVSNNAIHPLDILPSRKGLTIEVGNTDAEGRLILADVLWEAASEDPDLIVDYATLTGAARVALGTELPACYCNHETTAAILLNLGDSTNDPLWRLPLHTPYRSMLESKIADLSNVGNSAYGGSITAALFLQEFIKPPIPWVHIDLMAWNLRSLPGRPEGGEAMGMRALFELIRQRFTKA